MSEEEHVQRLWTVGSYPDVGRTFLPMAGHLVDAADVGPDDRVLDVACGTGNVTIGAARRGAQVTGLDITPAMLEDARANAAVAGVDGIDWREGDAADLPFEEDAFDVTLSCVGHIFAEPASDAAAELLRVTRPGGRIAFTSWTPTSVVPAIFRAMQTYLPPDPDPSDPPFLWGDPDVVTDRLGDDVSDVEFATGTVHSKDLSPAHHWEAASANSGLLIVALEAVDEADEPALRADVVDAIEPYFDASRNTVAMEYRLTTATVR